MHTCLRWLAVALGAALLLLACLLAAWSTWPPISTLMAARSLTGQSVDRQWVPLSRISPDLAAAVIASEDGQYCRHHGVDWDALNIVLEAADEDGPSRGASTIAMQTAKNLFLWPSRSAIRKAIEIPLALTIDALWGKRRVLEVYLNIAEWGGGLFGAQAAARRYFNKDADQLTLREASLLAAALPNPLLRNPARPGARQARHAAVIGRRVGQSGPVACAR